MDQKVPTTIIVILSEFSRIRAVLSSNNLKPTDGLSQGAPHGVISETSIILKDPGFA
jgi:hypothetical protein